jgi:ABC-type nickel/cobalt efflux system permease component RcnA
MITLTSILALGFLLGMRHATDADHVIAVSTIVSRERDIRRAAMTGVFWGVGHSITLLVVGGAIVLFGVVIPHQLGLSLELCVAFMLIGLGAVNLRIAVRRLGATTGTTTQENHEHPHRHGDYIHSHPHGHAPDTHGHSEECLPPARLDRVFGRLTVYRALRPAIIGVVHGLAGSAAIALLLLPIFREPILAMIYLVIFGAGTIAGMMLITTAIALPVTYTSRFEFLHRHLGAAAGVVSLMFGFALIYQVGFVGGLFR